MKHTVSLLLACSLFAAVPHSAHALLNLSNLLPAFTNPAAISLPLITNTLTSSSESASTVLDLEELLGGIEPVSQVSTILDGELELKSLSSRISTLPFSIQEGTKEREGMRILIQSTTSGTPETVVHTFPRPRDWSDFNKVGMWVYPDTSMSQGTATLLLSVGKTPEEGSIIRTLTMPSLRAHEWTYISFDLMTEEDEDLPIGSYALSFTGTGALSLNVLPLELGPGKLHHFKITRFAGDASTTIRVIAEDEFGNVLDYGENAYEGTKDLSFITEDTHEVNARPTAPADASFTFNDGISEPIELEDIPADNSADLEVTNGTIRSTFGDLSYNLLTNEGGELIGTETSAEDSVLSAAPDPATVGSAVLASLVARTEDQAPRTTGGDTVQVRTTGAETRTLSARDNEDGTYEASFTPSTAGTLVITATINGSAVGEDSDGTSDGSYTLEVQSSSGGGEGGSSGGGDGGGRGLFGEGAVVEGSSSSCSPYLTKYIKRGENNDPVEVLKLQHFLREREGMVQVPLGGVYDATTFEAVKVYQAKNVKTVLTPWQTSIPTGYVYILTLRAINTQECGQPIAEPPPITLTGTCPLFTSPLRPGSSGTSVSAVQQFLVQQGYMETPRTWGFYGPLTAESVRKFQAAYWSDLVSAPGLASPSGLWLSMTMSKANELACT